MTSSSWESSFHKIASVDEVPEGTPRVFRAAGSTIVVRREGSGVTAIDGSCLADASGISADERLRRILNCVAAGTGSGSAEWQSLVDRAGLPARVEDGAIWVCIEACS